MYEYTQFVFVVWYLCDGSDVKMGKFFNMSVSQAKSVKNGVLAVSKLNGFTLSQAEKVIEMVGYK